jgi:hypothetical protein
MQERAGSCMTVIEGAQKRSSEKLQSDGVLRFNDGSIVPQEKIAEMQAYARKLRKSSPKMKDARVQRKVAEHFKIKLT